MTDLDQLTGELRPGVHRIVAPLGERFISMVLFAGEDSALLLDTGIRESITETLLPYLERVGPSTGSGRGGDGSGHNPNLRWAINSHCDFDHTGGNGALKQALPDVEILAHRLDQALTEDVQRLIDERYGEFRELDGFDDPPETTAYLRSVSDLIPLDRVLDGGEVFDLGGRSVRVLHVPGHSPGHVAVWDEANRTLAIGDATLGDTVPFADGRAAFPPTYRDTDPYLASIATFRALNPELLLTAHYPLYAGPEVAEFLDLSERYTHQVDDVIMTELAAGRGPITTLELIRSAGTRLGPWGSGALDYAIFPVTGNLERLADRGQIRSRVIDGRRHWEVG